MDDMLARINMRDWSVISIISVAPGDETRTSQKRRRNMEAGLERGTLASILNLQRAVPD